MLHSFTVCDGDGSEAELSRRFRPLPRRGLFALLKEPLQSCNHPCGRFNFEMQCPQTTGPLAARGLDGRDVSSEGTPK